MLGKETGYWIQKNRNSAERVDKKGSGLAFLLHHPPARFTAEESFHISQILAFGKKTQ